MSLHVRSRVRVKALGLTGVVDAVRADDSPEAQDIFTVVLDDPKATPDGLYYARDFELEELGQVVKPTL